jgi:diguanylate cyclase (GGDEF)-like protein
MGRGICWLVAIAIALAGLIAPVRAAASEPLYARGCVLASQRPLSAVQAQAARGWTCRPTLADARAPYVWLRFPAAALSRGQDQRLESDAMPVAGVHTVVRLADGTVRERHWSAAAIARHWTSGTRFSLPLYRAQERPTELYVRIDRPFDRQVATAIEVVGSERAGAEKLHDMILFGVFTGMLLVVALYSLSLWAALRAGFALAHAAMVGLFLVFTISSSSLIFLLFPAAGLWLRTSLSYIGLAGSMAMMAPFLIWYLEPRALTRRRRRMAYASGGLIAAAGLLTPLLGPHLPFVMRNLYHLAYAPGLGAFAVVCWGAWRRGSRAVRLVALAWVPPLMSAIERIVRAVGLYELPFRVDFALFVAMAFQAIVMAFAIAWRIGEIRKERDRALEHGDALAVMAKTDSLTGLPNRRAFDARHWRAGDYLAVVDVDRFKRINDRFGHASGDEVLRAIGAAMRAELGENGVLGAWRMGGEEFTVLVAGATVEAAALQVNRIRGRISAAIGASLPELTEVTVSAGLALIEGGGIDIAYERADRALYHAKASGRDRLSWQVPDRSTATIFPRRERPRAA